ncbi:alpha/beta hydrolase [Neotabrizicola shimadae]|uniref:Alpha/beta hydrolase n=1 Tax=Neotabrizicola shimadae TaxID=2807096 RepID=A0A8G1ED68_9RHOB|nr:alpha/beta hydrolase [Neotabrizicola shimadae]QYZ69089.1 alpha/beta hydrolase [Neotabrizicola shimadae]
MSETELNRRALLLTGCLIGGAAPAALAEGTASGQPAGPGRQVPARWLPVPDTVSPELAAVIAGPLAAGWDSRPTTAAAWKDLVAASVEAAAGDIAKIKATYGLRVSSDRIAGVSVFRIDPATPSPEAAGRVLMHLHGGGYVFFPGEAGAGEGMLMAALAGWPVISVDYRMPPDHPFPAALDDAMAVWRALAAQRDPGSIGVFGASAGGGLTLALMLAARDAGLPLPGAIAPGTPWADLTGAGDSLQANAFVDNVLVSPDGWSGAAALLYAAGRDLADPLISPLHGDFAGFPPAMLTSGTRDLLLSQTVRAHRRLRQAGVVAELQVYEGQSHAQFLEPFVPETEEAFREIGAFFARHLA